MFGGRTTLVLRSGRRLPPLAALLLVLLLLLLFNFPIWRLLALMETSLESALNERLRWSAHWILDGIRTGERPPAVLDLLQNQPREREAELLNVFEDTNSFADLAARLSALQLGNELDQAVLITTSGLVVADSTATMSPGEDYRFAALDAAQLAEARAGRMSATTLYVVEKRPFKRLYAPMVHNARVVAVMQVSISPEYLSEITLLRRRVWMQSIAGSVMLLIVAVSVWRLFVNLVAMEQRAMQSARVEAMGALAGGVAHELRNPLSIVRVLAEEIRGESPPGSRSAENAADIIGETDRLNEMVAQFLSLSRPPDAHGTALVELGAEIARVTQLVRKGTADDRVRIETDLPDNPVLVRADERALRQVFLNLLINANEAMDGRTGTIRVGLRERRGRAEVTVADTGHGIAPRDLARVFEPFFTTKRMGTGLGLALTRGIVDNLGGSIRIQSEPGRGTEVVVALPTVSSRG